MASTGGVIHLRLAVLWLAGADLRLTVLAVPPVLPLIHHQFALSERAVGALLGLPVLLFGLVAVPGSLLIARLGARRATIAGLFAVAASSAARGIGPSSTMLFTMTFVMAAGVAVMQPALPTLVAEWFAARAGFATAVYANGLLIGEGLPAALTIPWVLPLVDGSWRMSFVVWALPVAATALLLALCPNSERVIAAAPAARWWPDWKRSETWLLGLMQGGTGGLYFAANTLIPDYLHAAGLPQLVTAALSAINLGQLPASLVLLMAPRRLGLNKAVLAAIQIVNLLGILALLADAPWLRVAGAGIIGFGCAFSLIVTLALPPQLALAADVPRLSAGMLAVGYSFSCLIPIIGGAIWDLTHVPAAGFAAPAVASATVLVAVLAFRFPSS
ncbi:MAG: MFS transporter [Alphaproteobacteria bacterium]|nr:MFS transporter [Alphaproteobacteria bacterium]